MKPRISVLTLGVADLERVKATARRFSGLSTPIGHLLDASPVAPITSVKSWWRRDGIPMGLTAPTLETALLPPGFILFLVAKMGFPLHVRTFASGGLSNRRRCATVHKRIDPCDQSINPALRIPATRRSKSAELRKGSTRRRRSTEKLGLIFSARAQACRLFVRWPRWP